MKYELNSLIGQITEADCEEVLAQLPDKCVDLVLADPPYIAQTLQAICKLFI